MESSIPQDSSEYPPPQLDILRREIARLRLALFSQSDPVANAHGLRELAQKEEILLKHQQAKPTEPLPTENQSKPITLGRFLGADTTKLRVKPMLNMQPLPTGVYHLIDPEDDTANSLLTVLVKNEDYEIRRVCLKAYLENLSTQAVRTVEIPPRDEVVIKLLPSLIPERAKGLTEIQRAALHLIVEDLDGKIESHDTFSIVCLARSSSFNSVSDPQSGKRVDLSHYYGAWVTPHIEPVQERIRRAADLSADRMIVGYQGGLESVQKQVEALFKSLKEVGITYINTVIDYGAGPGQWTQRTRLPRESLSTKSANCIDGAVLLASLLEGSSLNAAIVLIPGHAFVGWQTWHDKDEWCFLETTMIGTDEFAAACRSGQQLFEEYRKHNPEGIRMHKLTELRARKIWPME